MGTLIDELSAEHANMALILNILEGELDWLDSGQAADTALIRDIADYFLDYPDACHHPKEDAVYRCLVASRPVSMGPVIDIESEHKTLAKIARSFAGSARAVDPTDPSARSSFVEAGHRFIDAQRQHIGREERELFPMALDALSESDWESISARVTSKTDPVFKNLPEARFEALREKITTGDLEVTASIPA